MKAGIRSVSLILAALFATPAFAEDFMTTVSGGFDITSYDALGGSNRWQSKESGNLGVTARHGNEFSLAAKIDVPYSGEPLAADNVIDELAISWSPAPVVMLTAGKQNLKWGTARVFSSIDRLVPPLDPLDPGRTRRGVTGIRADIIPTWWLNISTVAIPPSAAGGYVDKSTLAFRTEILAGETDLSFGAIRSVAEDGDEEPAIFADFARFFDRFGVYGEAQVVLNRNTETSATGGIQIDIPAWLKGTITCLGEYRYNSKEQSAAHQLYVGLSGIPISRRLSAGLSVLTAPEEKQAYQSVFGADLDWKISQTINANLEWNYLYDSETSEYPLVPLYTANRQSLGASVSVCY